MNAHEQHQTTSNVIFYVSLLSSHWKKKLQKIGSEMDEEEMMISESENSNESWTTEEFSSEFIMRYGSR